MNVSITPDGRIRTSLYEKPMALYLYISPHSAHPPDVLRSHITGKILRILYLNSDKQDAIEDIKQFFIVFLPVGTHITPPNLSS